MTSSEVVKAQCMCVYLGVEVAVEFLCSATEEDTVRQERLYRYKKDLEATLWYL